MHAWIEYFLMNVALSQDTLLKSFIVTREVSGLQTVQQQQLHSFIDPLIPPSQYWEAYSLKRKKRFILGREHFQLLFCCELMASKLCIEFVALN